MARYASIRERHTVVCPSGVLQSEQRCQMLMPFQLLNSHTRLTDLLLTERGGGAARGSAAMCPACGNGEADAVKWCDSWQPGVFCVCLEGWSSVQAPFF